MTAPPAAAGLRRTVVDPEAHETAVAAVAGRASAPSTIRWAAREAALRHGRLRVGPRADPIEGRLAGGSGGADAGAASNPNTAS